MQGAEHGAQRSALNLKEYINVFRYLKLTEGVLTETAPAVQLNNKELLGLDIGPLMDCTIYKALYNRVAFTSFTVYIHT